MKEFMFKKMISGLLALSLVLTPMNLFAADVDHPEQTQEDINSEMELDAAVQDQTEDISSDAARDINSDDINTHEAVAIPSGGGTATPESIEYQVYFDGQWHTRIGSVGAQPGVKSASHPIEAFRINYEDEQKNSQIEYRAHISRVGWQAWTAGGTVAGTVEQGQAIQAIEIRFKEGSELNASHDVYYRVSMAVNGDLGWASNGETAGTTGMSVELRGVNFCIIEKEADNAPVKNGRSSITGYAGSDLRYSGHVQRKGDVPDVTGGQTLGTSGESLRLEGIKLSLNTFGADTLNGGITYRTYVQNKGWLDWKSDGAYAGTNGESLRLESVQVKLTGEAAEYYNVYYRLHVQNVGWMGWSKNGETSGTAQLSLRAEAMQVVLVAKGADQSAYNSSTKGFISGYSGNALTYSGHVQTIGDTAAVKGGQTLGTVGRSLRMEGIKVALDTSGNDVINGGITYNAHVQNIGWQGWKSNGEYAGTTGKSLRVEAIQIKLTGEAAKYYDVYYRTQVQNYGWLGWAKNGQSSGTAKCSYRMEAIQIKLVAKTSGAPGSTAKSFVEGKNGWFYEGGYKYYYRNNKRVEDVRSIIGKQSSYVIMVNKQQSTTTIYAKDGSKGYIIPVVSFICSPGSPTPLGTFYTPEKYRWKALIGNSWGQYSTRITGGFLFHSVPYKTQNIYTMKASSYNLLGTQVSAGCVRLRVIDAKWMYDNCPLKTKVVIYNSSVPGPFGKPAFTKIPASQTWDPTDPAAR